MDGAANPQDIPRLPVIEAQPRYIADEAHDVYLLQCLKTNARPIELIARQMLRRVQIVEAGDANYIVGEQVERSELLDENDRVNAAGKIPATYENVLLGITKASLSTDSFISA
jgi:DNA-directed RNA polymerase subunit beta'